jgi:hypothetical protein
MGIDKATRRGTRARRAAEFLIAAAREYGCTAMAAEAMSTSATSSTWR